MQEPIKIYRIENPGTMHGMWYELDGTYNPFIKTLTEGKSKDLPMDYHERYAQGGLKWFSGCPSKELMQHWFSPLDAWELYQAGYRLYQFTSTQYIVEEYQVIFTREGIIDQLEIPLEQIWNIEQYNLVAVSKLVEGGGL